MICSKCGKQNQPGSKFCFGCGNKLQVQAQQPVRQNLSTRPLAMASIFFKDSGKEIQIPFKPEVTIGRTDKDNGILPDIDLTEVDNNSVTSRKHGCILYSEGKYSLKDIGSMNGTFINGSKLQKDSEYPLEDGDEIVFGKLLCTFKYSN